MDLGINSLAVVADELGNHIASFKGVKQLREAEHRLIDAQKRLARTKPGSKGHNDAKATLNNAHRKVAQSRKHLLHQVSSWLVRNCNHLAIEDLSSPRPRLALTVGLSRRI